MTYCVATMMNAGIVFASDSRTNAGVDNIATFRKMKIFERQGDRVLVLVNSGNLAVTQATLNHLDQAIRRESGPNIMNVGSMYEVAELVGAAHRRVPAPRARCRGAAAHVERARRFRAGRGGCRDPWRARRVAGALRALPDADAGDGVRQPRLSGECTAGPHA